MAVVGVDGQEGMGTEDVDGKIRKVAWEGNRNANLQGMASDLRWRIWERWLASALYGQIVHLRLEERDGNIRRSMEALGLGRNERKVLERHMRRFVIVEKTILVLHRAQWAAGEMYIGAGSKASAT